MGLFLALWSADTVGGTIVRPPVFDDLVQQADRVVHGRVIDQHSFLDEYEGRRLVRTVVTIEIVELIKGENEGPTLELRFMGGEAEGWAMEISGMPHLAKSDEVVLFEKDNGRRVCPLVSWQFGHFMVEREETGKGVARVLRADRTPLQAATDVSRPLFDHQHSARMGQTGEAMTLTAFKAEIRGALKMGGGDE
jgi:hypothetical protein